MSTQQRKPVVDFVANFIAGGNGTYEPLRGRVVMSPKQLVLLTNRSRTNIPLGHIDDIALGRLPERVADLFDDTVLVGYATPQGRRTALVGGDRADIDRFSSLLYRATLRGLQVTITYGARVGGRVESVAPTKAAVRLQPDHVEFIGEERTVEVGAEHPRVTVGRSPDNDVHVDRPSVSRRHAEIVFDGEAGCTVRDLDSSNGTYVDGDPVQDDVLSGGEDLRFGDFPMVVERTSDSGSVPEPPGLEGASGPPNPPDGSGDSGLFGDLDDGSAETDSDDGVVIEAMGFQRRKQIADVVVGHREAGVVGLERPARVVVLRDEWGGADGPPQPVTAAEDEAGQQSFVAHIAPRWVGMRGEKADGTRVEIPVPDERVDLPGRTVPTVKHAVSVPVEAGRVGPVVPPPLDGEHS